MPIPNVEELVSLIGAMKVAEVQQLAIIHAQNVEIAKLRKELEELKNGNTA
jgi:hypothetical protein